MSAQINAGMIQLDQALQGLLTVSNTIASGTAAIATDVTSLKTAVGALTDKVNQGQDAASELATVQNITNSLVSSASALAAADNTAQSVLNPTPAPAAAPTPTPTPAPTPAPGQ